MHTKQQIAGERHVVRLKEKQEEKDKKRRK